MTQPLTTGEKNRRANIKALKKVGKANAKLRAKATVERFLAHVERNNQISQDAAAVRMARRLEGIARRDAHNAELKLKAAALPLLEQVADVVAANDDQLKMAA